MIWHRHRNFRLGRKIVLLWRKEVATEFRPQFPAVEENQDEIATGSAVRDDKIITDDTFILSGDLFVQKKTNLLI